MQNTVYHGQSPLGFLSPENLPRCSMNLCLLLWTRRTGAAASSERFLLKEVVAVLLFCLFLPLRGKIKAWYVAVRIPEARGSKKKTVVSHILYFCTAKGRNGPVVWPEGINFENCTAVKLPGSWKEVFQASDPDSCHGGWEWRCSGQASLSTLRAEVSCSKPWWLRMLLLAEFVISVGSPEMKDELKGKPTRGQQGKMLARNIFLSVSSQRLLTMWVHISSSKGSSEKNWRKEAC